MPMEEKGNEPLPTAPEMRLYPPRPTLGSNLNKTVHVQSAVVGNAFHLLVGGFCKFRWTT